MSPTHEGYQLVATVPINGHVAMTVYNTLDDMLASPKPEIPSGVDAKIQGALHHLREATPRADALRRLESIAVTLHRMRMAMQRRHQEDLVEQKRVLSSLTSEWLNETLIA